MTINQSQRKAPFFRFTFCFLRASFFARTEHGPSSGDHPVTRSDGQTSGEDKRQKDNNKPIVVYQYNRLFYYLPFPKNMRSLYYYYYCVFSLSSFISSITAYRIGDPVDTELAWDAQPPVDVLRVQMPRFAVDSQAQLTVNSDTANTVTLSFEDGLWGMPAVSFQSLERLVVQFVYSAGAIHAIHSEPHYYSNSQEQSAFTVQYIWMEEPHVNPETGQIVLFLVLFVVTARMVWSVLLKDASRPEHRTSDHYHVSAVPKYE